MNHKFLAMAALGALTLGACSNQDVPAPAPAEGDGTVTFTVAMPAAMHGRAYADGQQEKTLSYAVYDATADELVFASGDGTAPEATGGPIDYQLKLNLVKGKTYDFIFWADAKDNTHYTFDAASKTVTVNYTEVGGKLTAEGNDDSRDAFFQAVKGVRITGPMQQSVELRRPFAQLNFGTDDIAAAAAAKTEIAKTDLLVKGVYTKLDLFTGIASEAKDVTFTSDAFAPATETFPGGATYTYLTMDYVLTGIELEADEDVQNAKRELFDATMTFTFTDGQTADVAVPSMPMQRNYRTNVFGSLLTSPLDLTITVVPGFYGEPGIPVEITEATTAEEFMDAVNGDGPANIIIPNGSVVDLNGQAPTIDIPAGSVIKVEGTLNTSRAQLGVRGEGNTVIVEGSNSRAGQGIITSKGVANATGNRPLNAYDGGTLIVRNVTVETEQNNGGSAIFSEGGHLILENVTVNCHHFAVGANGGSLTIKGGQYNSDSNNKVGAWSYTIGINSGCQAVLEGCEVNGVQGGVCPDGIGTVVTIKSGKYTTTNYVDENGTVYPWTAFYPVYACNNGVAVIEGGEFISGQPSYSVVAGDNDIQAPWGLIELRGGKFNKISHSQETNSEITPVDGFVWQEMAQPEGELIYEVVAK